MFTLHAALRRLPMLLLSLAGACASHQTADEPTPAEAPAGQARLQVINRSSHDVDVYLEHGGQRSRLGVAPAAKTTRFSLGSAQVVGAGTMRFVAVPIGGSGEVGATEPVSLQTGQVLTLDVPPI
jgi:hypothetical protein